LNGDSEDLLLQKSQKPKHSGDNLFIQSEQKKLKKKMLKYCLKFLFQFLFRNKTTINAPKYRKVGIKKMMEPIQTEKRDQES
jgi:hypothetical protein